MSLLTIDKNPPAERLRSFGLLLALFVPLFGALVWWRTGRFESATSIWMVGGALTVIYWLVPPLRKLVYVGWMYAAFPIGWTVSHLLMAAIYYLAVTPVALILKATGRDPMNRKFDRAAKTYWIPHDRSDDIGRYFRQY